MLEWRQGFGLDDLSALRDGALRMVTSGLVGETFERLLSLKVPNAVICSNGGELSRGSMWRAKADGMVTFGSSNVLPTIAKCGGGVLGGMGDEVPERWIFGRVA